MELRQLRYFVKLSETLNFSEAAKALCVTQSTLSQQIKQLEQELDTELLFRTSHTVALTEAGAELLPFAKKTLNAAQLCTQHIEDLKKVIHGSLSIGVTYSFSPMLTETLVEFMNLFPGVTLNILYKPMSELMDMLKAREIDFALAFRPSLPIRGVESHPLFQNYMAVIVGDNHPLANEKKVSLQQLSRFPLALPSKGLQARNALDLLLQKYPVDLDIRVELNEVNILLKLLRRKRLATVLAEATIHDESGIKAIPLEIPANEMQGCVHTLTDSYHKQSMKEFIRLLSESMAVRERRESWL